MADRLFRAPDPVAVMQRAMEGMQSGLWTAMPAKVLKYDASRMTAEVQVAVLAKVQARDKDGTVSWVALPPLVDCPVVFPRAGGFLISFPVQAGDECLVVFASRCIDAWWQSGGTANQQPDIRMHDLSDGFVFLGPSSQPELPAGALDTQALEIRNDAGTTKITLKANGDVTLKVPGANVARIEAGTIQLVGNVAISGGTLTHNGTDIGSTHKHSGVTTGASNTGNPV